VEGIFYIAEAPGADPFTDVGARVEAQDTVGIVEVMKLMNHIRAGVSGEVVGFAAADGDLVQIDQPLVWISPEHQAEAT
jgi:biotin carboxyl carrier protein